MSTVAIILRKNKPNADGTYPLAIRITKSGNRSIIHIGYSIKESDWDNDKCIVRKSYPNSARLNNFITKKLSDARDAALELETVKHNVTSDAVKKKIKPSAGSTFFAQAEEYLKRLNAAGKYNQYSADKPRVKHFREFLKGDVAFQDITVGTLDRFKSYLKNSMSERTAVNHLVMVRSVFSLAIKDGVCDSKYYPFGKGKVKIKFPDSHKLGLTMEEVQKLEEVELNTELNHTRNLWLFSYYLAGMRISDVFRLKWKDIHDGRLWYAMGKNNKGDSLKVPEKAMKILDQYRNDESKHGLIFHDLNGLESLDNAKDIQIRIKTRTRRADNALKIIAQEAGIEKNMSCHISRHTFGQIAGDKIDIRLLQKLYRHSSLTTTIGYQSNFIHKLADDALDAVLGG